MPVLLQDRDKGGPDPFDGANNNPPPSDFNFNYNSHNLSECRRSSMKKDEISNSATVDKNGNDASFDSEENIFIEDGSYLSKKNIYKNFLLDTWRPNTTFQIVLRKGSDGKSTGNKGEENKISLEAKRRNILTQRILLGAKEGESTSDMRCNLPRCSSVWHCINLSTSQSVSQCISLSVHQSVYQSISASVSVSVDQSVYQSVSQSVSVSVTQSVSV